MEKIKLRIIGCGDAFGSGGRLNTCFYVEAPQTRILIDCGATALPGLVQQDIKLEEIDTIIISHFHGDHYGGIPFVLMDAAARSRKKRLSIITPEGGKVKITALLELLYPGSKVLEQLAVDFLEYKTGQVMQTAHFGLMALPVIHSEASLPHGLRISIGDKVISYSGDTSWTETLIPLSAGADLFICECCFFNSRIKGHMTYVDLQPRLADLNCKRILLTHFDREMLKQFELVKEECASDGMELMI